MLKCSSGLKVSVCSQKTNRASAAVDMKVTRNLEVAQRRLTLLLWGLERSFVVQLLARCSFTAATPQDFQCVEKHLYQQKSNINANIFFRTKSIFQSRNSPSSNLLLAASLDFYVALKDLINIYSLMIVFQLFPIKLE